MKAFEVIVVGDGARTRRVTVREVGVERRVGSAATGGVTRCGGGRGSAGRREKESTDHGDSRREVKG